MRENLNKTCPGVQFINGLANELLKLLLRRVRGYQLRAGKRRLPARLRASPEDLGCELVATPSRLGICA
jgi:hypothetical protein